MTLVDDYATTLRRLHSLVLSSSTLDLGDDDRTALRRRANTLDAVFDSLGFDVTSRSAYAEASAAFGDRLDRALSFAER